MELSHQQTESICIWLPVHHLYPGLPFKDLFISVWLFFKGYDQGVFLLNPIILIDWHDLGAAYIFVPTIQPKSSLCYKCDDVFAIVFLDE